MSAVNQFTFRANHSRKRLASMRGYDFIISSMDDKACTFEFLQGTNQIYLLKKHQSFYQRLIIIPGILCFIIIQTALY